MVHTFVVGCGDVGKTTLIHKLKDEYPGEKFFRIDEVARTVMKREKIRGADLPRNPQLMWNLQAKIITEQIKHESKYSPATPVISDRSFLDAVVYGLFLFGERFPGNLAKDLKEKNIISSALPHRDLGNFVINEEPKVVLQEFCNQNLTLEKMENAIKRYRKSLFVLLHHPWNDQKTSTEDDGTRYHFDKEDVLKYTTIYKNLLRFLGIPFIEIKHSDITSRVKILKNALEGVTNFQIETLELYEKLSDRKEAANTRKILEERCQFLNLPFYLVPNKDDNLDIKLPTITISQEKVKQDWNQLDPGKVNRIVDKYGTNDLIEVVFDPSVKPDVVELMLKNGLLINGEQFSLLGCSSSGLKERKCCLWRGSNPGVDRLRQENGNFSKLKTIPKQMARFSLLLSNVQKTGIKVEASQIIMENDVENDEFNFTDGCGGISLSLAQKIFRDVYAQEKLKKMKNDKQLPKQDRILKRLKDLGYDKSGSPVHECYKNTLCPSVLQIRYQGYKGVLVLDSELKGVWKNDKRQKHKKGKNGKNHEKERKAENKENESEEKFIKVRPSMLKFETTEFPFICVCDYSKPYTFGHLNLQYIRLLSSLGVPDEVFLKKQEEHLNKVRNMLVNTEDAIHILQWNNQFHTAQLLLWHKKEKKKSCDANKSQNEEKEKTLKEVEIFVNKKVKDLQQKLAGNPKIGISETPQKTDNEKVQSVFSEKQQKAAPEKLRILIPESRNIFGVCEPTRTGKEPLLKEGQCFLRVTVNGRPKTITGKVVASKNPCYLPSDVRVLEAVTCPELEKGNLLVDCIVYPLVGKIPHSAEIAGSDLDGDNYFVSWDKDLIPPGGHVKAYEYPGYEERSNKDAGKTLSDEEKIQERAEEMSKYFSIQSVAKAQVGKIDSLYGKWANKKGIDKECIQLGQLFARAVDSTKSGERISIPTNLKINDTMEPPIKFVWQKMLERAKNFSEEFRKSQLKNVNDISEQYLVDMLVDKNSNLTEFAKFRLVMQFLDIEKNGQNNPFETFARSPFWDLINFGLFTPSEKGCVINDFKFPINFVMNSLSTKSILFSSDQIFHDFATKFNLENENVFPWQLYFQWHCGDESFDQNLNLQELIYRAVDQYSDVLVAIQVPDGVCFVLRFEKRSPRKNGITAITETPPDNGHSHQPRNRAQMTPVLERDLDSLGIRATSYFYSPYFNYSLCYELQDKNSSFKIDLKDDILQLYRGQKTRTFIQFKLKETVGDSKKRENFRKIGCFIDKGKASKDGVTVRGKGFSDASNCSSGGQTSDLNFDPEANSQKHSISVDLTSFASNILTDRQKGRHPLVRKTPVLAIETFVFNRKNEFQVNPIGVAYLDILCGNQLSILYNSHGIEPTDSEQHDPLDNPVASLQEFEKLLATYQSNQDDSLIINSEGNAPSSIAASQVTGFLENLSFALKTRPLAKKVEKILSLVVKSMTEKLKNDAVLLVKVTRSLCGLGMFNIVEEVLRDVSVCKIATEGGAPNKTDLICASNFCADWKLLAVDFCLNRKMSQKVLEMLIVNSEDKKLDENCAEKDYSLQEILNKYVLDSVKKEHASLIEEFEEKQKQLLWANSSFEKNKNFLAVDTPETIGNLGVEPEVTLQQDETVSEENKKSDKSSKPKAKENEITLFRLNILPFRIHHWNNQFVILTRQLENLNAQNYGKNDFVETGINSKTTNDNENDSGYCPGAEDFPTLAESVEFKKVRKGRKRDGESDDDAIVNTRCKEQVVCIGRVIRVQEVPFNITVQVVAETDYFKDKKDASLFPGALRCCLFLDSGNSESVPTKLKWRLSLIQANVVTYSRIMDALKVLARHDISKTLGVLTDSAKKDDITSGKDDITPIGVNVTSTNDLNPAGNDALSHKDDLTQTIDDVTSTGDDIKSDKNDVAPTVDDVTCETNSATTADACSGDVISRNDPSTSSSTNLIRVDEDFGSESSNEMSKNISKLFNNDIVLLLIYPKILAENVPNIETPEQSIKNPGLQHESFEKSLNESQQQAVELARNNRISLIHGPPGTGKSTTACAIVRDVLLNFGYRKILICAETNLAVDNLLLKFKQTSSEDEKDLKLLRLNSQQGRESRNPEVELDQSLQELSLESKLKTTLGNNIRKFSSFRTSSEKKAAQKIIQESRIVFTTCAGAGDPLLDHHQFEFVLVDEATMSRESTSLCALAHGCKHLVLIGDPCQLGPTNRLTGPSEKEHLEKCHSQDNQSEQDQADADADESIPDTLFHKFHAIPEVFKTAFLDTQHRMHSYLAQFPSEEFYKNQLKSANYIDEHRRFEFCSGSKYFSHTNISKWWPVYKSEGTHAPLCFIDVPKGVEQRKGTSYCNEAEAKICCKIWLDLLLVQAVGSFKNIAILTLYKGQVEKLKETFTTLIKDLKNRFPLAESKLPTSLPEINSVDSFQGRENDVILVSTVRTKDKLGFSGDRNRINVLLTRGKKIVCVIGNQKTLKNSSEDSENCWQRWFEQVPVVKSSNVE